MNRITRRHVLANSLIRSRGEGRFGPGLRTLSLLRGLSGLGLLIALLFSWFLASCGTVSKQPPPTGGTPDFSLSPSPGSLTITQGSNGSSTITVAPQNGFTGSVTLAASGLPNGVTASFSTNPTTATSTLTLAASSTATTGTSTATVTGTSGSLSHTTTVALTVNAVSGTNHYEYVFTDGTLYVYDLDAVGFPLVKSKGIPTSSGTRGAVACAGNGTLYVSFGGDGGSQGNGGLLAYDLVSDAVVWTQNYSHGIDSHAITPDCAVIYMPDGELANTTTWHVVDAKTGNETGTIAGSRASNPHNTIVFNGHVYLGGRQSTLFQAANASNNTVYFTSANTANTIRPFTINAEETAAYITETNVLGFQQIDLTPGAGGAVRFTVPVAGFSNNCSTNCPTTPSHGISMSPDERWLYVVDSVNSYVHVFDISGGVNVQPVQRFDVKLNHAMLQTESACAYDCLGDGWLHHSLDGRYVFVGDSGDVIDTGIQSGYANSPAVVGFLPQMANSRKEIEIDFQGGKVVAAMTNRGSIGTGAK